MRLSAEYGKYEAGEVVEPQDEERLRQECPELIYDDYDREGGLPGQPEGAAPKPVRKRRKK